YTGTVTLQFSDGRVQAVKVTVIVSNLPRNPSNNQPQSTQPQAKFAHPATVDSCTPKQLLPALTTLGQSFEVSAGWPVSLAVDVLDDCGAPLETGSVTVSFSNGDPAIVLQPLKGGHWAGTWPTRTPSPAQVTLKVHAENPEQQIHG